MCLVVGRLCRISMPALVLDLVLLGPACFEVASACLGWCRSRCLACWWLLAWLVHGLFTGHDYHLITLLVLNECGAGVPIAWLISSREDQAAISCLLTGLMKACRDTGLQFPTTRYFMSDKAPAYYNAWVHATGQTATQHLLCAWHVVKAWKAKLPMISVSMRSRCLFETI